MKQRYSPAAVFAQKQEQQKKIQAEADKKLLQSLRKEQRETGARLTARFSELGLLDILNNPSKYK